MKGFKVTDIIVATFYARICFHSLICPLFPLDSQFLHNKQQLKSGKKKNKSYSLFNEVLQYASTTFINNLQI